MVIVWIAAIYFALGFIFTVIVLGNSPSFVKMPVLERAGLTIITIVGWPVWFFVLGAHRKIFWERLGKNTEQQQDRNP